jgi:hypothetical protein
MHQWPETVTRVFQPGSNLKPMSKLSQQFSDLFTYLLIPGLAVLLPVSFSRSILYRASCWKWFMAEAAEAAFQGVKPYVEIEDEARFKRRWKQIELLDVRDLYLMSFGRTGAVLEDVEIETDLEVARDRVIIGMHWGPSISILKILQSAGLDPALPFRPPERHVLRIRPFYYLFSTLAARYMVKTMGDRAIPVGGAGKVLRGMLDQPGSVIVVMDAPPMQGRPTLSTAVIGKNAIFNAGFPDILADKEKEYVFYALSLQVGDTVRKKLELEGPFSSSEAQAFLQNYAEFLSRHLLADPAQWRIWHAAQQFWRDA